MKILRGKSNKNWKYFGKKPRQKNIEISLKKKIGNFYQKIKILKIGTFGKNSFDEFPGIFLFCFFGDFEKKKKKFGNFDQKKNKKNKKIPKNWKIWKK